MSSLLSLTKTELSLLADGYTRKTKHDKQYIAIELCNIIILYSHDVFHFFIIFEKLENGNHCQTNELLCFNMEKKEKSIIENECWKYIGGFPSYCVELIMKIINIINIIYIVLEEEEKIIMIIILVMK